MVLFAGKYTHIKTVNTEEFFKLVGVEITAEKFNVINGNYTTILVEENGNKYTIFTTIGAFWQRIIRFTINEKFKEGDFETMPTRDGNKLIFNSWLQEQSFRRIYEFSESGLVVTLDTHYGGHAVRTYKRI